MVALRGSGWIRQGTGHIAANGVTVSLLHTGKHYPDDISEDGLIYHYPKTARPPSRDAAEVAATKNAANLNLPIFVVLPGETDRTRRVRLGWVEDWDDEAGLFIKAIDISAILELRTSTTF
jgi:putative restriction endonuclease